MEILQDMKSQAELINEILTLKRNIYSKYFGDPKIKKNLEEEICYDYLIYDRLLHQYKCKRNGAIYLGGHKGEMLLTLVLLGFKKILIVEPQPELFKQLQETISLINQLLNDYDKLIGTEQITSIKAIQCAVGDINSEAEFYVTSKSQLASVFKPIEEVINEETIYSKITVDNQIVVPVRTIDSLIEESGNDISEFNFLYMNIQGSELKALQGSKQTLSHLDSIYLEQNWIARYENCPEPEKIDNYLEKSNFVKVWQYLLKDYGVSYDFYITPVLL